MYGDLLQIIYSFYIGLFTNSSSGPVLNFNPVTANIMTAIASKDFYNTLLTIYQSSSADRIFQVVTAWVLTIITFIVLIVLLFKLFKWVFKFIFKSFRLD